MNTPTRVTTGVRVSSQSEGRPLVRRMVPSWMATYRSENLGSDISAGVTVAVLLIPQAMAYALLGGLPPAMGLYASFVPLFMYALLGTSRQLAVGPTAMDSMLVLAGASAVAQVGSTDFLVAATLLAGLAGVIQFGMGALRLGFVVNFLSRPVVGGFTSAAAIIIAGSQINAFAGIAAPRANTVDKLLVGLLPELRHVHFPTLGLSMLTLFGLLGFRRWAPRWPASLLSVIVGTVLTYALKLDQGGVRVVGYVPPALPGLEFPSVRHAQLVQLLPSAAMIALVGFMEAISVAKALAENHQQSIRPDRELMALGLANLGACLSGAYPVTGGFSRSAVADDSGAKTQLTGVVAGIMVGATLLWFTPLFVYLPQASLSALVLYSALGLIRGREPFRMWDIRPVDAMLWTLTFAVTLFVGIGQGIISGVVASLLAFIHRSSKPFTAELGRLPGTTVFRNLANHSRAEPVPGVLILRMDASLYFANTEFFERQLNRALGRAKRPIHAVLIDGSPINDVDTSALLTLGAIVRALRSDGKGLYFANLKRPVMDLMQRSGLVELLGNDHFFLDLHTAARMLASKENASATSSSLDSARL